LEYPNRIFVLSSENHSRDEWMENELQKPENECHIIVKWAKKATFTVIDPKKPIESTQLNGSALTYLHLAYDLFVFSLNKASCCQHMMVIRIR